MNVRLGLFASLALAFLVAGTGCSNKTQAELDSLRTQNAQFKSDLDAERAARQAAEARANAATAAAATPAPETVATPGMEGGPVDLSGGGPGLTPARNVRTTPEPGSGFSRNAAGEEVIELPGDVLFDSGKRTIKPAARKILDTVATTLKSRYPGQEIRIEGYTDPAPVKSSGYDDNYDLGAARANSVRIYLESKGVRNMYIASFGPTKLKSTRNMALNRRVDIVVVRNAK